MDKRRIFICFSTYGGQDFATHVYKFCKERLEYDEVFLSSSKKEILAGENWTEKRDKALKECEIFIFIATSDVTTSGQVEYEIKEANRLRKWIIPCKHTSIDDWSEIEKMYDWDSMQYLPFDGKYELITELHPQLVIIAQQQQQQSPKQRVAEESTELRLRVKSYQCEFRFKPPNNGHGTVSEVTKDKFAEKTKDWIENLKAKATHAEDKSDDKEIVYLLNFTDGCVTISFDKDKDGNLSTIQKEQDWYTRLIVKTDKLEMIDRIVKEVDSPYWVYKIYLIDKLDLAQLQYQIEEKSGLEITGSSEGFTKDPSTGQNISNGRQIYYHFGRLNKDAKISAQLSSGENEDSVIQIWFISGGDDVGFYQYTIFLVLIKSCQFS